MTDSSSLHTTHTAPVVESLAFPSASVTDPVRSSSLPNGITVEEEEDYTIRCICGFDEDDGQTIFCESCDTWQHVDCYYHRKDVPGAQDEHICVECNPNVNVDTKRATERQRKRKQQLDPGDRKLKKPFGKSHKKKVKPPDQSTTHTNGWPYDRGENGRNGFSGSPKDYPPPAKRSKTSHRATNSMFTQTGSLSTSAHSSKRSTSASHLLQSPSKTPTNHTSNGYQTEPYSHEFLHLYEDDPGDSQLLANSFNDIQIAGKMSLWSNDIEALTEVANGRTHQDIFMRCEQSLDTMQLPPLKKESKVDDSVEYDGIYPTWTCLKIDTYTPQNALVGELRGKIGDMKEYVKDPSNRWEYLRHPLPFVFFHPYLPIYIDTRREGTICRYLRRSCTPNLNMKTILENGSDYHFCFVANQDLEAGTELTVGWTLDEHVRTYLQEKNDVIKMEGATGTDESYVTDWVGKVLADFGGCACNGYAECSMAKYDRRNSNFSGDSGIHMPNGKHKKARKSSHHVSSHSTGRTTNSRSGSEAFKHQDDDEQDDSRSTSVSTQSKPNSRDMTPSNNGSGDKGPGSGLEISDREKRKIAALEKTFEQLDHDKQPAPRKKKQRISGGSTLNTPTAASSTHCIPFGKSPHELDKVDRKQGTYYSNSASQPSTPAVLSRPRNVEAGISRRRSGSPINRSPFNAIATPSKIPSALNMPSVLPPPTCADYVDSSMQTDPDMEDDWTAPGTDSPRSRKPFVSLTKRLLMKCRKERVLLCQAQVDNIQSLTEDTIVVSTTPENVHKHRDFEGDVQMVDGETASHLPEDLSNVPVQKPRPPDEFSEGAQDNASTQTTAFKPPPLPQAWPLPSPSDRMQLINGSRATDLRVQLPPRQLFSGAPSTPTINLTPNSLTSSMAQSPITQTPSSYPPATISNFVQPSPVKRLSLVDYISRRNSHKTDTPTTASAPTVSVSVQPSVPGSSPTMTHRMLRPSESIVDEAKEHKMDGIAISETSKLEGEDPMEQ